MIDRRTTIKWLLAASAVLPAAHRVWAGAPDSSAGYGADPDLIKAYHAGECWPLTLNAGERATAAALCDAIIPGDAASPGAASLGIADFIDEWVSAPYAVQRGDRTLIVAGLAWIESQSSTRFGKSFAQLEVGEQATLCDAICSEKAASAELAGPAHFFARYRDLTAGGFYSSAAGRNDLNYIGNMPMAKFAAPPKDLLRKLGLATP